MSPGVPNDSFWCTYDACIEVAVALPRVDRAFEIFVLRPRPAAFPSRDIILYITVVVVRRQRHMRLVNISIRSRTAERGIVYDWGVRTVGGACKCGCGWVVLDFAS